MLNINIDNLLPQNNNPINVTTQPNCIILKTNKIKSKSVNIIADQNSITDRDRDKNNETEFKNKQPIQIKSSKTKNDPIIHSMFPKIQKNSPYFIQDLKLLKKRRHSQILIRQYTPNEMKCLNTEPSLNQNTITVIEQCQNKRKQYLMQMRKIKKLSPCFKMRSDRKTYKTNTNVNSNLAWAQYKVQSQQKQKEITKLKSKSKEKTKQKNKKSLSIIKYVNQKKIEKSKININNKQKKMLAIRAHQKSQPSLSNIKIGQQSRPLVYPTRQFFSISKVHLLQPIKIQAKMQTEYINMIKVYNSKSKQQRQQIKSNGHSNKQIENKAIKKHINCNTQKLKLNNNSISNKKKKNKKYFPHSVVGDGKGISPWQSVTHNFMENLL